MEGFMETTRFDLPREEYVGLNLFEAIRNQVWVSFNFRFRQDLLSPSHRDENDRVLVAAYRLVCEWLANAEECGISYFQRAAFVHEVEKATLHAMYADPSNPVLDGGIREWTLKEKEHYMSLWAK
jgi:hypothetical protein